MQLLIDLALHPVYQLRAIARLIDETCTQREFTETPQSFTVPAGTITSPTQPTIVCNDPAPLPATVVPMAPPAELLAAFANVFGGQQAPALPSVPAVTPPPFVPDATVLTAPLVPPASAATVAVGTSASAPAISLSSPAVLTTDVDKDGLPWDARIHSSSKEKVKAGTWKRRKNLDTGVFDQVVNELRQSYPLPAHMQRPAAPPPAPVSAAAPALPQMTAPAPVLPQQPPATPNTGGAVALPQVAPDGRLVFQELIKKVSALTSSGKITNAQVPGIVYKATGGQLQSLQQVLSAPQYCPVVSQALDAAANGLLA